MRKSVLIRLLMIFALLFAQQAGAAHALHHVLEDLTQQQEDKQAPHSSICEQCADYAQLGSALGVAIHAVTLLDVADAMLQHRIIAFRSLHQLAATARAPPLSA